MTSDADHDMDLDIEGLVEASVREILRHEDSQRFRDWLYASLPELAAGSNLAADAKACRAFATVLGLAIWNAMPLPGNRFRPAPLPVPRRNDPCPCGSGSKFKQCCGAAGGLDSIPGELVWHFVLEQLSPEQFQRALAEKALPVAVLVDHAEGLLAGGDERGAEACARLLAPLFEGDLGRHDGRTYAMAFETLARAHEDLGQADAAQALTQRVVGGVRRSPLRAAAWQRLAVTRIEAGDSEGAWQAFAQARRDEPDTASLAHLEMLLLYEDDRLAEVPGRARDWIRRLLRRGFDDDEPIIEWLSRVAADPAGELAGLLDDTDDVCGDALLDWLDEVRERPLPEGWTALPLQDAPVGDDGLRGQLRSMGISGEQAEAMLASLDEQAGTPGEDDDGAPDEEGPDTLVLVAPAGLEALEDDWHEVFPLAKPFSVSESLPPGEQCWESETQWAAFLSAHPQACDSLDILDDLATVLTIHPGFGHADFDGTFYAPLLERARDIVEHALAGVEAARLAWTVPDNRPALRALVRLASVEMQAGDATRGLSLFERVLELNPHDNHGLRCILADEYLRQGRDEDVVALCARYPEDGFAETLFDRALALYRLQREDEARAALERAAGAQPLTGSYLLRKRVRRPPDRGSPGFRPGGEEEAYQYWASMREVWERTPGALAWLKRGLPAGAGRR